MNQLRIDFAQQTKASRAWPQYALLLIGCLCTAVMVSCLQEGKGDVEGLTHETQALVDANKKERDVTAKTTKATDLSVPMTKALAPLVYPWASIMAQIELAAGEQVNVTRFDHRYDQQAVRMIVNTSNFAEAQFLLSRLNIEGQPFPWTIRSVSRSPTGLKVTIEQRAP